MVNNINKRINIIMPYTDPVIAYVQYVQTTKDGKYILNYLEKKNGNYTPNFTEIMNVDGKWYKKPFHLDYEEYDFEDFNKEISNRIIEELPENMKIKIIINDDRKKISTVEESNNKIEINSLGATEIVDKIDQDLYYVLIPNTSGDIIDNKDYYPFDFPFPAFSIDGKTSHSYAFYSNNTNKDLDYNELEFSRYGISINVRKKINEYIQNLSSPTPINDLPVLEFEEDNARLKIHFVNCSEIIALTNTYKAKSIYIDCDIEGDISVTELFKRALSDEIPYYYESEMGTKKDNGVRHKGFVR